MEYTRIEVSPISGACGAEIGGIDLAEPLDNETFSEVHQAFLDNQVIFFREQKITPDQHKAFGRLFGTLNIHPQYEPVPGHPEILPIVKEPTDRDNIGDTWHSDVTFLEKPPLGSILYALEVPPVGGDTMFANQYLAYESLSDGMRSMLDGLVAVHSSRILTDSATVKLRNSSRSTKLREDVDAEEMTTEHPLVRTHPETGRKSLFMNLPFTVRFKDMSEEESKPLLRFLCEHASKPEFTCRFRWAKGSVAMWDNRCLQHYALNDYQGYRRSMHRVTVDGDRPF